MKIERDCSGGGRSLWRQWEKNWWQGLKYDGSILHECLKMMNKTFCI